jgi:RNA polymerase sigma-70 factor, ECF subfamily
MPLSPEERILFEGCRRGDEAAWLALYRAYAADIGRYLQGMLRQPGDIDDLIQTVFLEFLGSLDRFRGDASLRTWLHRIARHVALQTIRSQARRRRHVSAYAETVQSQRADPDGQLLARDRLQLVQALLAKVDENYREAWLLRELQGLSVAETAAVLEIPEATVRTRHYRARRRLLALVEALDEREAAALGARGPKLIWSRGDNA